MAEQERAYLGMTHNPFANPRDGFYEGADRKSYLDQLRHLSQWSRRVLLVTGPPGVGKTTLYRQLSATLEPRAKAARVSGTLINSAREVLVAIAQGFGIAAPLDANTQLLNDLICNHVNDQQDLDRYCVTLVDDADLLEPRAIDRLLALVAHSSLCVVLFGEARIVAGLEKAARRLDIGWHEIRLSGFSAKDIRAYLEWRFQQARYRGRLPMTEEQVKTLTRESEGLPGRINQLANALLFALESGTLGTKRRRFPAVHGSLVLLLLVVGALSYLLWRQDSTGEPEGMPMESAGEPAAPADLLASAAAETPAEQPIAREVQQDPTLEPTPKPAPEPVRQPVAQSVAEPIAQPVAPPIETPVTPPVAKPTPVPAAKPIPQSVAKPVAKSAPAAPAGTADGSETVIAADAAWLLRQPAANYTMQLVTVSSTERARAFIAEQPARDRFATYQLRRDGKTLYVVVCGSYSTQAQAQAAADRLGGSAARLKPWIRPMAQIHDAIRSSPH